MEPFAAKTLLISLLTDWKLKIASFTTDRSSSIKGMMQADVRLSSVRHEYDPWHWISKLYSCSADISTFFFGHLESVMKDIWDATKLKTCLSLLAWKDSISNMLWWSFATCRKFFFALNTF